MSPAHLEDHPLARHLRSLPALAGRVLPRPTRNPAWELPELLVEQGWFSRQEVRELLEDLYGVPALDLEALDPDPEALVLMPEPLCKQWRALPVARSETHLLVVMADPWDLDVRGWLEFRSARTVVPAVALEADLLAAHKACFETSELLGHAIHDLVRAQEQEAGQRRPSAGAADREWKDAPVIKLVNFILQRGLSLGASDIHLEPYEDHCSLRYRIDGALHPSEAPSKDLYPEVLSRIKVMANLDVASSRLPQDGRLSFAHGGRLVEFRVSTLPLVHGEGACLRILDKSGMRQDLAGLGFPETLLPLYQGATHSPHGLIIVSGPTGSGKSTTLYATLAEIATPDKKVITVEDPVEYRTDVACQSPVRGELGYDFATGLRAILRHDPDILMIGEMRDHESAEIAIRAAMTGHLVLSTLHTNDSVSVVSRLVDMGIPHFLVSATLRMVVAQRLVRMLCPRCRQKRRVPREFLESLAVAPLPPTAEEVEVWGPGGCDACNHLGYAGRSALFEVLDAGHLFRHLRDRDVSLQELTDHALAQGLVTLRDWGLRRVLRGETSLEEVLKVTADAGLPAARPNREAERP